MRLNWKDIHLTNENIYNGSLNWHRGIPPPSREGEGDGDGEDEEQHIPRIPTDWDFSHLDNILETVLQKNPRNNVYLYGSVESAYDSSRPWADVADQAPVLVAITLPAGAGVPTRTVGRVNNQTTEDNLISFEDLNYTWVTAPSFGGRVHFLSCNADTAAIPDDEEEAQMHQHCSLFVATPREIKRDAQGRYKVDHVTFSFSDKDGEEEVESWDRSDGPLRDHLDQIVDDYFEDSDPEERASARERIEQAARIEVQRIRQRREQQLNLFFVKLNWNEESLNDLKVFKITPVNFPASITNKVDRYFNEFSKQQAGGPVCYSDHASISGGAFVQQVPSNVLTRFNGEIEPLSPTGMLFTFLLVDFLKSTFFIESLRELNIMTSETPVIFDRVIQTFGIDRVLQHFGQNTTASSYSFMKQRLREVVRGLCRTLEEACKRANRIPSTPSDFLLNFIWQNQNASNSIVTIPNVVSIRLGQFNNDGRLSRIRNPGSLEARVSGFGATSGFVPISIPQLKEFVSKRSLAELLLELLCNPQVEANVPPGARDDDHDHEHERRDCLKAAILEAPDVLLSPYGKRRVDAVFPEHEVTIAHARSLLESKVKTIRLKEIKRNVHHYAMNSDEVMVGVFNDGPLKHCVLIDGSNSGCITDPASFKKGLVRSKRTLKKLQIDKFRQLFVVKRVELNTKTRASSAKRLGLPFLPSVSENDSKSAP